MPWPASACPLPSHPRACETRRPAVLYRHRPGCCLCGYRGWCCVTAGYDDRCGRWYCASAGAAVCRRRSACWATWARSARWPCCCVCCVLLGHRCGLRWQRLPPRPLKEAAWAHPKVQARWLVASTRRCRRDSRRQSCESTHRLCEGSCRPTLRWRRRGRPPVSHHLRLQRLLLCRLRRRGRHPGSLVLHPARHQLRRHRDLQLLCLPQPCQAHH